MNGRSLLPAAFSLLAACGGETLGPGPDLSIAVEVGASEVRPGEGFPLTVVRTWGDHLEPTPFDDRALSPLAVRLESTSRRAGAHRVEETRRYRAYAFSLADVAVRPAKVTARPKDGGPDRTATAGGFLVRVRPEVDPKSPGEPEGPGEPPKRETRRPLWLLATALAVALVLLGYVLARARGRRAGVPVPPAPQGAPPPTPAERALARLAAIRSRAPAAADALAVSDALRDYVAERFAFPAHERTSEEIVAAASSPGPSTGLGAGGTGTPDRAALSRALFACDGVKFAALDLTEASRAGVLADAESFVRGAEGAA